MAIDVEEAKTIIAKNWGWILSAGVVNVIGGCAALLLPLRASGVAVMGVAYTLLGTGLAGIGSGLFGPAEQPGFKTKSLLYGVVNVYLYYRMAYNPFDSLNALTMWIGATTITDGFHEVAFAFQNKDAPERFWTWVSGVSSVVMGAYAIAAMPISSLVVPGFVMGVHFISSGLSKIVIGMAGQEEASGRM